MSWRGGVWEITADRQVNPVHTLSKMFHTHGWTHLAIIDNWELIIDFGGYEGIYHGLGNKIEGYCGKWWYLFPYFDFDFGLLFFLIDCLFLLHSFQSNKMNTWRNNSFTIIIIIIITVPSSIIKLPSFWLFDTDACATWISVSTPVQPIPWLTFLESGAIISYSSTAHHQKQKALTPREQNAPANN